MSKAEHPTTTLAEERGFRVEYCPCGSVHVHVGAVSMRLTREHSETLTTVLARAMVRLAREVPRDRVATDTPPAGSSLH